MVKILGQSDNLCGDVLLIKDQQSESSLIYCVFKAFSVTNDIIKTMPS